MPNSAHASAAAFMVGQSESLPIRIPTNGLLDLSFFIDSKSKSGGSFVFESRSRKRKDGPFVFCPASRHHLSMTWRDIAQFLALKRNTTLLLGALVLAGTGERLWLGFVPKYLQTLGAGVFIIGLFDALQVWLGAVYAFPGGWLTDHWGQRRSLILFSALSLAGYLLVLLWHSPFALL